MLKAKQQKKPRRLCFANCCLKVLVNFGPVRCLRAVFVSSTLCLSTNFADKRKQRWPPRCERGSFFVFWAFPWPVIQLLYPDVTKSGQMKKTYTMPFLFVNICKYNNIIHHPNVPYWKQGVVFSPIRSFYNMSIVWNYGFQQRYNDSWKVDQWSPMYKVQSIHVDWIFEANDIFDLGCFGAMAQFSLHIFSLHKWPTLCRRCQDAFCRHLFARAA